MCTFLNIAIYNIQNKTKSNSVRNKAYSPEVLIIMEEMQAYTIFKNSLEVHVCYIKLSDIIEINKFYFIVFKHFYNFNNIKT